MTAEHAFEPDGGPRPEEERRILHARAEALARERTGAEPAEASLEVIEFVLAAEHYGIETAHVQGVLPFKGMTPVPCTPPFILGIVNVRGRMVSVVDLKAFFDLPRTGLCDQYKLIVLHSDAMEFGILADDVLGMRRIPTSRIQPALPTLTGIRERYLRGVAGGGMVVLDGARLLTDNRLVVQEGG